MRWCSGIRPLLISGMLGAVFGTVCSTGVSAAPVGVSLQVDAGLFYNDLTPYGDWLESPSYGYVWAPRVSAGWRPYTLGRWVWTDEYGWLWVSDEPFGWAAYHYGRWNYDPGFGWAWVPGYEWGPAWVSFRRGGGYTGWAPLPSRVGFDVGIGFRIGPVQFDTFIGPDQYTFVQDRDFVQPGLVQRVLPQTRNITVVNVTKNITNINVENNRVVNKSIPVQEVERVTGRRVQAVKVAEVNDTKGDRNAKVKGDQIQIFKPAVQKASADKAPPKVKAMPKERQDAERRQKDADDKNQADQGGRDDRQRGTAGRDQQDDKQRGTTGRDQQDADKQRADEERQRRDLENQKADQQRRDVDKQRGTTTGRDQQDADKQRADQDKERQQLEQRQAREKQDLERQQQKNPPRDTSRDELNKRDADRQAMEERQRKEKQQLDERQQREKQSTADKDKRPTPKPKASPSSKDKDKSKDEPPKN